MLMSIADDNHLLVIQFDRHHDFYEIIVVDDYGNGDVYTTFMIVIMIITIIITSSMFPMKMVLFKDPLAITII